MDTLLQYLHDIWDWLIAHVLWPFQKVFEAMMGALGDLIAAIPVPAGIGNALAHMGELPAGVVWFLTVMQVPAGLSMVMAAYLARWLLRRIPLVG